jgi:hypothetical protein
MRRALTLAGLTVGMFVGFVGLEEEAEARGRRRVIRRVHRGSGSHRATTSHGTAARRTHRPSATLWSRPTHSPRRVIRIIRRPGAINPYRRAPHGLLSGVTGPLTGRVNPYRRAPRGLLSGVHGVLGGRVNPYLRAPSGSLNGPNGAVNGPCDSGGSCAK